MPFKLGLKKRRHYSVASKSLFVLSVELLDSNTIECTLSSESTGRECLENVCQRLGLQQPDFFGLRYINKNGAARWIEMKRPVKKQLDKNARDPNLYLRVMYYVDNVSLLHDEITRYHYFLQLKMDVIEERISCNPKQAVILASYSMQAEFGNHDLERHTTEYLKDFALFPKHLTEGGLLENLTQSVILQHATLGGMAQGTAEEYYIIAAQQLDGYGQETFFAKDEGTSDVVIGICLTGIAVHYDDNSPSKFYPWKDITNVVNHKRYFGIECQEPSESTQFHLSDVETAKYIWRMCVNQHTFFIQNDGASEMGNNVSAVRNLFTQLGNEDLIVTSSHEELDVVDSVRQRVDNLRAQSTSCLDLAPSNNHEIDRLRSLLPSYRQAPDYETAVQQKYRPPPLLYSSQPEIHQGHLHESNIRSFGNSYKQFPDVTRVERVYLEHPDQDHTRPPNLLTYSTPDLERTTNGVIMQVYKPPPPYPNRPSSNSTPDLASQTHQPSQCFVNSQDQVGGSSPDLVSLRGGLRISSAAIPHYTIVANPTPYRTYTNLADPHQQLDDGRGNMVFLMSRNNVHHNLQPAVKPQPAMRHHFAQQQKEGGLQEPIYENVPLAWSSEPRSRAASIQSAPPEVRSPEPPHPVPHQTPNLLPQPAQHLPLHSTSHTTDLSVSVDSARSGSDGSQSGTLSKTLKTKGMKWASSLLSGKSKQPSPAKPVDQPVPRLPLSPTISKEAMCQLLEKKLTDSQLFFEFEKIPKQKNNQDFTAAIFLENITRNRFTDIFPYEDNRVRLVPSRENKYGYINASHITASVGNQQRFYIAAQSPLTATVSEFWQMVWEADVYLVVSLISPGEEIAPYLPIPEHLLQAGHFEVMCQFSQETGHCATSKLRLHNAESKTSRGVWHLQYTEWGHQGCPNTVPHFLGFLEELGSVRQHTVTEIPPSHNRNPPVLVHCATGVGPSAVTILTDLLLYTIDHNQELDIARVVYLLRHQRMHMIQNISQYRFVHSLIIFYLKNSRLI